MLQPNQIPPPTDNPYASPVPLQDTAAGASIIFSQGVLATRWQRFLAQCIDVLLALPINFGLAVALGVGLTAAGITHGSIYNDIALRIGRLVITAGTFLSLHGYLLATRGQTIGKYFLNTQIVSDDGEILRLSRILVSRYLPIWTIAVVPYGGFLVLVDVLAIFREERKCLHDEIAGTKVIQIN